MMANGNTTINTDKVQKNGTTTPDTKEPITKDTSMATDLISGQMAQNMKAFGMKIELKAKASTTGMTEESTMVIGLTTTCTEKVPTPGLMEEFTKVNTTETKNTAKVSINGRMVDAMMENGKTASNTALVFTQIQPVEQSKWATGMRVKEIDG